VPQAAFAADTSNTQINSLLASIFGSLVTSGQDNPIAAGIGALNGIVLIVGGLLVAYTIVVGTIGTAQDGEMMGKKFSSIWVPIRTALGTAFILPVFSGGYCLMQALVMWIIMQGVNLAGTAWSGYVNNYSGNIIKVSENVNTSFKSYGYNMFKSYVCIESAQNIIYQLNQPNLRTSIKRTEYPNSIIFEFGFNEEFGFKQDSCGVIEIPKPKSITKDQELALSKYMSDDYMKNVIKGNLIEKAHFDNVNNLFQGMQGLAKNLVKSGRAVSINEIDSVISIYDSKIRLAVKEEFKVLENSPNLNEKNNATDWLLAGAYYMRAFWGKEVIENSINNFGVATGYGSFDNKVFSEKYEPYNRLVEESLAGNSVSDKGKIRG
jgi:conjugal transfer/type IV secretion protein DotA/TraY